MDNPMGSFLERWKTIEQEIEQKRMASIDFFIETLKDYNYCDECDAEESMYIDTSCPVPTVRCVWCGFSVSIKDACERACNLPWDVQERMIQNVHYKSLGKEQIGTDLWITDGYIAEIAGDIKLGSYPDRDKFPLTTAISPALDSFHKNESDFEEAIISSTLFRGKTGYERIAMLKSKNKTVYINDDYTKHIYGIYKPFIRKPLQPVFVKAHGKVTKIILPMRFDPKEVQDKV